MSNYNDDLLDDGLQSVMGKDRCQNVWDGKKKETKQVKHTHEYRDGKWEPVKEETWMDRLKGCAKWAAGFGGLSFLLFYWNQAGLMAESIAVPCMCICTALAGWGIGKEAGGK